MKVGKKRIFVVDDDPLIASTLGLIFKQAGFDASSYADPLKLLQACEQESPDAVVSDVMMPNMTGIDLALSLRQLYPACKVILMSGHTAIADILEAAAQEGHAFEVLNKPVRPAGLIQQVRQALN